MENELDFRSKSQVDAQARLVTRLRNSRSLSSTHGNRNVLSFLAPGTVARMLYLDFLYQKIIDVPGVIIEFGVQYGPSLSVLSNLRAIHEPYNHTRKIIGFDTFTGFPAVNAETKTRRKSGIRGNTQYPRRFLRKYP